MAIVQEAYFIPEDIATGLATGLYQRFGSVIRYAIGPKKGRIYKHLKPIKLKVSKQSQSAGVKALQFVKGHKIGAIIVVASTVIGGISACVYTKMKKRVPKIITEFRNVLKVYIDAIRLGDMDINKINNLMFVLDKLKQDRKYEKISIQLTAEDLEVLVGHIYKYTIKLAIDNKIDLKYENVSISDRSNTDTITNLQSYLTAQKRIFELTA